mmetsp:Transcript_34929/g.58698  ORF Transcript_34929/g.58698 Transcript_34929/m.58698 type:complete len:241 (-) Transcript_34929:874-1596(-)
MRMGSSDLDRCRCMSCSFSVWLSSSSFIRTLKSSDFFISADLSALISVMRRSSSSMRFTFTFVFAAYSKLAFSTFIEVTMFTMLRRCFSSSSSSFLFSSLVLSASSLASVRARFRFSKSFRRVSILSWCTLLMTSCSFCRRWSSVASAIICAFRAASFSSSSLISLTLRSSSSCLAFMVVVDRIESCSCNRPFSLLIRSSLLIIFCLSAMIFASIRWRLYSSSSVRCHTKRSSAAAFSAA